MNHSSHINQALKHDINQAKTPTSFTIQSKKTCSYYRLKNKLYYQNTIRYIEFEAVNIKRRCFVMTFFLEDFFPILMNFMKDAMFPVIPNKTIMLHIHILNLLIKLEVEVVI